jgi:hypothetical protein
VLCGSGIGRRSTKGYFTPNFFKRKIKFVKKNLVKTFIKAKNDVEKIDIFEKKFFFLVYSSILTFEMVIMGFCYTANKPSNLTGGDNFFSITFSWAIFLYLLSPSVLLFLTRYRLFVNYL